MEFRKRRSGINEIAQIVEANTNIPAAEFLAVNPPPEVYGMAELVDKLKAAKDTGKTVRIISDYDMDGDASGAIGKGLFEEFFGHEIVVRPPRRFSDGYGISVQMVEETTEDIIVTVDNGVAAVEPIARAKELGKEVYIIDHHQPREDGVLPDAEILVDPHVCGGYSGYCASGLMLRLAEMLLPDSPQMGHWKALAAMGTVADVVPLIGDNRRIVIEGLASLRARTVSTGLQRLLGKLKLEEPTEEDIGFGLGPCCNAAGRLLDNGAEMVTRLLTSWVDDMSWTYEQEVLVIDRMVEDLVALNEERRDLVKADMKAIEGMIARKGLHGQKAIVLDVTSGDPRQSGWVGILAGQIAEKYKAVACVFAKNPQDDSILKGSGRSPQVHLKHLLDKNADILLKYGGHAGAAGLSLKAENLQELGRRMNEQLKDVMSEDSDTAYYDCDTSTAEFPSLIIELARYAPYGAGNPAPKLHVTFDLIPKDGRYMDLLGKDADTVKLYAPGCDLLAFHARKQYEGMGCPTRIECIGTLSENVFLGKRRTQFIIEHFRPAAVNRAVNDFQKSLLQSLEKFL